MILNDPYRFLGVDRSASDDEIRNVYKSLAKKYHPDNYDDSQLKEFAREKTAELNSAYDKIMDERKTYNVQDKFETESSYSQPKSKFSDVRKLIIDGRITDAEQILNGVPETLRDAEWYFLKGTVLYKKGWLEEAHKNLSEACALSPHNKEYIAALNQVENHRKGNFDSRPVNPAPVGCGCSACDVCSSLICADCCCECMGGDFIRCC